MAALLFAFAFRLSFLRLKAISIAFLFFA